MTDENNSSAPKEHVRRKNWAMLVLLLILVGALFGLSFIRFGQAVYS